MVTMAKRLCAWVLMPAAGCMLASVAWAAPMVLKISHQFPANTDFRDQVAQKFAKEVEARTHGELKFQIYPGASLYKPNQQFDAMASGALDMSVYPLAYSGGKVPGANLTLMPALKIGRASCRERV